jgi:hypothetical protein
VPQHRLRHFRRIVFLTADLMGVLDIRVDLLLEVSAYRQREIAWSERLLFGSAFHFAALRSVPVRPWQYEVVRDHHVELIARSYLQRWRDVHSALKTALRDLSELLTGRRAAHLAEQ